MVKIKKIIGREVLDSRGNPTVEADVILDDGTVGSAMVPSGASTGSREALELRDNDKNRFLGKGVLNAVKNINDIIGPNLVGKEPFAQREIDKILIELDGTDNKSRLGANAILSVSLAVCRAASQYSKEPLYVYIRKCYELDYSEYILPIPLMNLINGGVHADNNLDIQEFMIIPSGKTFKDSLRIGCEIFHTLKKILKDRRFSTNVGDEGGFAPNINSTEEAIKLLMEGIKSAGYTCGKDVYLALDTAASELYENGFYIFSGENKKFSTDEIINFYEDLINKYPIKSIEDGMSEEDREGWKKLTEWLGKRVQLVGDDVFVTNPKIFSEGIKNGLANAILVKVNQIGTLTETVETVLMAYKNNYKAIISHRSGETEDDFISDLSVALNTGQIKTGSISRGERTAKYNRLLRIEEEISHKSIFVNYFRNL